MTAGRGLETHDLRAHKLSKCNVTYIFCTGGVNHYFSFVLLRTEKLLFCKTSACLRYQGFFSQDESIQGLKPTHLQLASKLSISKALSLLPLYVFITCTGIYLFYLLRTECGPGQLSRYSDSLQAGRSGNRITVNVTLRQPHAFSVYRIIC